MSVQNTIPVPSEPRGSWGGRCPDQRYKVASTEEA